MFPDDTIVFEDNKINLSNMNLESFEIAAAIVKDSGDKGFNFSLLVQQVANNPDKEAILYNAYAGAKKYDLDMVNLPRDLEIRFEEKYREEKQSCNRL